MCFCSLSKIHNQFFGIVFYIFLTFNLGNFLKCGRYNNLSSKTCEIEAVALVLNAVDGAY